MTWFIAICPALGLIRHKQYDNVCHICGEPSPGRNHYMKHLLSRKGTQVLNQIRESWKQRIQLPAKKAVAWHSLKRSVAANSTAMQGHESNGVLAGEKQYKLLWEVVQAELTKYVALSGEDTNLVCAKLPAINAMYKLAYPTMPAPKPSSVVKIIAWVTVTAGAVFAFSTLVGFATGWIHLIAHWVGR